MPPFTLWSIRLSLVYLVLAWLLELWRMCAPQWLPALLWADRVTVYHLFFVGWLTQLIFGVAHWMFPTQSRELPRGVGWLSGLTLVCLNLGIWLRLVSEPLRSSPHWNAGWALVLAIAATLQWLAAIGFSINIWRRVRGKKATSGKSTHAAS